MASEQFSLCWDNFHKNMSSGMHSLLESEDLVDVTLAVEGKFLKAHKMVLSVCSPYFRNLFRSTPCKHPIVFMKDVNYSAMCDLLQFMYQGEVQVNQENLTTFIKTAEALQIKGLTGDGNAAENDMENHHAELKTDPSPMKKPEQEPKPAVKVTRPKRPSGPALKRPKLSTSTIETPEKSNKVEATVTSTPEHIQFKMEPYESGDHSNAQVDDTAEDVYAEEALDDSQAEETEDYTLMEGNDEEPPQAGTSGDGTGEGQDKPDEKEAAPASVVCTEDDDASSVRSDISSSMMKLDPAELSYKSVLLSDEVVEKWNFCLWQGAGTEKRKELLMKYPSAENCGYLVPPEMNSEVALLLPKAINRQDKCLIRLQNLLASGLTALGISLNIFLEDSNYNKEIYANLTDAGQIFADAFNRVTCQRRAQAVLYVNLTCSKNKPRETNEMLLFAPPINIFGTKRALVPPVPQQNQRSRTAVSNANKAYQRRNRGSQRSTRGNVQHPRTTQGVMTHMRTKRLNQNMPVMQQQQPLPQQFRQPPAGPSGVTAPGLLSWKDYKKMKEKANQFDRKGKQQQQQQQQQQANRPNPWMYQ